MNWPAIWLALNILLHVLLMVVGSALFFTAIIVLACAVGDAIEEWEDRNEELELQRLQAIQKINDEMRATRHRMLAAAIDSGLEEFAVVDAIEFVDEKERS